MNRLDSLDWLRGLLAVSIMTYHLTSWLFYTPDAGGILGRLGVYGVSMFFVLSGLSMAFVYSKYKCDIQCALNFYTRRVFRIWPLLWIAIFLVSLGKVILNIEISWIKIFLNLTTLFGFLSPAAYINTGAWSIGNEMVYYALTPFILYLFNKRVLYGNLVLLVTMLIGGLFACEIISSDKTLASQWHSYINPFNNLFFYCSGVAIFYNTHASNYGNKVVASMLFIALSTFLFYPSNGDEVILVTGANRFIFSTASILMVIAFYKAQLKIPRLLSIPLKQLGIVTYGVYLLHPCLLYTSRCV